MNFISDKLKLNVQQNSTNLLPKKVGYKIVAIILGMLIAAAIIYMASSRYVCNQFVVDGQLKCRILDTQTGRIWVVNGSCSNVPECN